MNQVNRGVAIVLLTVSVLFVAPERAPAMTTQSAADAGDDSADWSWPFAGAREVAEAYRAPAHEYGPGHRGIDVVLPAGASSRVMAPAAGVVAFSGVVVDRPLVTIDHGGGVVSTFEPVASDLSAGTPVAAGDVIGVLATGGHAGAGTLHVGVRVDGEYVDPMGLFGDIPRAVLLPCCD